jgi:magnesium-transporting ATPase (P-type)
MILIISGEKRNNFSNLIREGMIPVKNLKTNRGLLKFILLSIITFGVYALVFWCGVGKDVNTIASEHDGKRSMNYIAVFLLSAITFGIVALVWTINLCTRIANELNRRNINICKFSALVLLWILVPFVGGFVFLYKLIKAMNTLAESYNANIGVSLKGAQNTIYCSKCGTPSAGGAGFCQKCGAKMTIAETV